MRQRLAVLSLAISTLVVIAFLIPLALLLRNQAQNRALSRSETLAQAIATSLVVDTATAEGGGVSAVSYTHLTLPTTCNLCRSRWSPYH